MVEIPGERKGNEGDYAKRIKTQISGVRKIERNRRAQRKLEDVLRWGRGSEKEDGEFVLTCIGGRIEMG